MQKSKKSFLLVEKMVDKKNIFVTMYISINILIAFSLRLVFTPALPYIQLVTAYSVKNKTQRLCSLCS